MFMKSSRFLLFLVLPAVIMFLLAGCASRRPALTAGGRTPGIPGEIQAGSWELAGYRILPHDKLEISVYDNPDLNVDVQVTPGGMISFPLIGSVEVGGLSAPEAEELLAKMLSEYIRNPSVNITVPQIAERMVVYVSGQVKNPDIYRLTPGMTAYRAVTVAGGFTETAAANQTAVVRSGVKGQEVIRVRLGDMLRSGDMTRDVRLMPGDTIIVPESFF